MSRWALGDCYFIFFFALSDILEKSNRSAKQRQQSGGLINVEHSYYVGPLSKV